MLEGSDVALGDQTCRAEAPDQVSLAGRVFDGEASKALGNVVRPVAVAGPVGGRRGCWRRNGSRVLWRSGAG